MNTPAIELKGNLLTLLVLRILEADNTRITEQLMKKISQAPNFFQHAPVVIDLYTVQSQPLDIPYLVGLLRKHGLVPVALRSGNAEHNEAALRLSLGLLADTQRPTRFKQKTISTATSSSTALNTAEKTRIVTQPVRSGQQIAMLEGDLIILSTVSPGAEVLAQRHIHIYGALRGRALAGVNGDTSARIFCQTLDAELVSIAGHYQINDEFQDELRDRPAQIYLEDEHLKIQTLEPYPR